MGLEKPLLVLGLDGLDPFLVRENRERLPNLSKTLDNQGENILESVLPPVTKPGWPCSFTGRKPESLGSFDMFELNEDFQHEFGPAENSKFAEKGFWKFIDSKIAVSGVAGVAVTELNGWIIGGPLSADEDSTYPKELNEELKENLVGSGIIGTWRWRILGLLAGRRFGRNHS